MSVSVTPRTTALWALLSFTVSWSLFKLMSSESLMLSISSSAALFSSYLQSFWASGSFPMSRLFALGGSSIGASTSASVLPVNFQGWFPLGLTGLIYLLSKGISSLLQHHSSKASILQLSAFFMVRLSHLYVITRKTIALITQTFVGKVMYLLFNMLSRFIIAFLPRSKHLLISWLQSPSTVIWEPEKIKPAPVSTFFPFICHEVMGPDAMLFVFLNVDFFLEIHWIHFYWAPTMYTRHWPRCWWYKYSRRENRQKPLPLQSSWSLHSCEIKARKLTHGEKDKLWAKEQFLCGVTKWIPILEVRKK